ncbi:MAG: GxxExxY protein [Candidatus Delongbacteria bacterium]
MHTANQSDLLDNPRARDLEVQHLCDRVREAAYALHRYLGHGHLEKVYQHGLEHRLSMLGLQVEAQVPLQVLDEDGTVLGEYFADLVIEGGLLIELKAVRNLNNDHIGQVIGYLRAARRRHALLINFGGPRFEIRKLIW